MPLGPIKPGQAVITKAYNLPNKYIIHCLGPVYGIDKPEDKLFQVINLFRSLEVERSTFYWDNTDIFYETSESNFILCSLLSMDILSYDVFDNIDTVSPESYAYDIQQADEFISSVQKFSKLTYSFLMDCVDKGDDRLIYAGEIFVTQVLHLQEDI
jgi:hypothetical protein